MGDYRMDNGEWMMRRLAADPFLTPRAWTADERLESEDTSGLKMLDEFLAKRRRAGDGDERK